MIARNQNKKVKQAFYLLAFALGMLAMSYAAVPLYKIFCKVTGYGGTPQISSENDSYKIKEKIDVRFASTFDRYSVICFKPEVKKIKVQIGENSLAFFKAKNNSDKPITTMSVFNVSPLQAGQYFNKIECFCFEEQVLSANEEVSMPVSFFVDASIKDDKFIKDLQEITLSYTMYVRKNE